MGVVDWRTVLERAAGALPLIYDPTYYLQPAAGHPAGVWEAGWPATAARWADAGPMAIQPPPSTSRVFAWLLDRIALPAALGGAAGAAANFLNSEILGRPTGGD